MRKTHGMTAGKYSAVTYPSIYGVWKNMKQRCTNPNNPAYHRYGGAGIKLCKRWFSFENFYADMGDRPKGKTLDRIDNTKGYYPSNCRWATYKQQAVNSSRAVFVTVGKTTLCISDWCKKTGITYTVFKARRKRGWSIEEALTKPPRKQINNRIHA